MSAAPRAVVLLSGGMDSAVVLAEMRHAGFECHALSFDYGQRHRVELDRAAEVARMLGAASHRTARIDALHRAVDQTVLVVGGDETGEGVAIELLDAQGDALLLDVDRQHHGFDFVALLVVLLGFLAGQRP